MRKHNKKDILAHAMRYLSGSLPIMTENNHKIILNERLGFKTIGVNFAPASRSVRFGGVNMCKDASPLCIGGCLQHSGHNVYSKSDFARIARTVAFTMEPPTFVDRLRKEIDRFIKRTRKKGLEPSVRINLLSDATTLAWNMAHEFSNVQFVDYTKEILGVEKLMDYGSVPSNLSWGISLSETNWKEWRRVMDRGMYWGAVVIDAKKGSAIPQSFDGLDCIDGDLSDARWLTPPGSVAVLRIKGTKEAKRIARKGFAIPKEDHRWTY